MVDQDLKNKVTGLIASSCSALGVKLKFSARIQHCLTLIINIQSCSIDLKQNLIDTIKDKLVNGRLLGTERECLERLLQENSQESEQPSELAFSTYHLDKCFSGVALELMQKIYENIRCDYYDNSDPMRDYHDVAYYYRLTIGKNKKGFQVTN